MRRVSPGPAIDSSPYCTASVMREGTMPHVYMNGPRLVPSVTWQKNATAA
ncbi:MAG: hypothetical protein HZC42_02855 [Candidatus Eisenbacteria bacterium]|nr:hypothetical protein [Candidatus Eisenbacteria bacterium]